MADLSKNKIEASRQYYAASGRDYKSKRKLSGEREESTEKREKKLTQETIENSGSNTSLGVNTEAMDTGELARALKQVMMDDDFSNMLTRKFKSICDERIDEKTADIRTDLKQVKEEQVMQKEEQAMQKASIEKVANKIDNLEQDKRQNNLLVRGIHLEGRNLKHACTATLNKELKMHLKTADITYAVSIGTSEDRLVKMAFSEGKTREEVYGARSKLKGKNIWITEDLTPMKAHLYYKSRQSVKEGLGALTWTHNGKIFFKLTDTSKPKIVNSEEDLPKPRPPAPS